ncbi:MAG: hypothetical protein COA79_24235 [Planctomycetota bacterium]|nr:MAG: hypothetical protein COA79_24235 [Planctomycetota bacterium]
MLSSLINSIYNFVILIDKEYKFAYLNHVQPGLKKEKLIGTTCLIGMPDKEKERLKNIYNDVFKTGKSIITQTESVIDEKGTIGWYEIGVSPLKMKNKPIEYLVISSMDITQRKAIEKENIRLQKELEDYSNKQRHLISTQAISVSKKNYALIKLLNNTKNQKFLTAREQEVLKYVEAGFTSKEIAKKLNISVKTVSNHRLNMNKKISQLKLEKNI